MIVFGKKSWLLVLGSCKSCTAAIWVVIKYLKGEQDALGSVLVYIYDSKYFRKCRILRHITILHKRVGMQVKRPFRTVVISGLYCLVHLHSPFLIIVAENLHDILHGVTALLLQR